MRRRIHASVVPRELREADALMKRIADVARLLPALTADNAADERARLVETLDRGETPSPRWALARRRVEPELWRTLDMARRLTAALPIARLYELSGRLLRTHPIVTRETVRLSTVKSCYRNDKAIRELGCTFRPFAETAKRITASF